MDQEKTGRSELFRPTPEPKPVSITCPLCHRSLGGIVISEPDLLIKGVPALAISVECSGGLKHSELEITTLDLAKKRAESEVVATEGKVN